MTSADIDQDRVRFLDELSGRHPQLVVWKHLERSLRGLGDIDAVAPRRALLAITQDVSRLGRDVLGASHSIVCDHVPNVRLQFLVRPRDLPDLFEFDIWTRPSRGSASWADPVSVARLSTVGEYGVRQLRPGAEALMLLVYGGLSIRGEDRLAGSDRDTVLLNLGSDLEGAHAACATLPPPPARSPLRHLVDAMRWGAWDAQAARLAMAGFMVSGLARPHFLARQGWFRLRYLRRRECLMFTLMRRHGRRVPPSGVAALLAEARNSAHVVTDL